MAEKEYRKQGERRAGERRRSGGVSRGASKISRSASKGSRERGKEASTPAQIPPKGWKDIALRVKNRIGEDNVSLIAAGVAFYAFLSLFPAIAAGVSIYALIVDAATVENQIAALANFLPAEAQQVIGQQLAAFVSQAEGSLGWAVVLGIVLGIGAANKGTRALFVGLNIAYQEEEGRGFFKQNALTLLFTFGGILLALVCAALVVALPIALAFVGIPESWELFLRVIRWVFLAGILLLGLSLLYRYAPVRENAQWKWVTPGSAIAAVLWLLGSGAFSYYVSNFGNYNEVYGSVGAVVILMLWFMLSSFVILLGAEINSEMEHQTAKDSTTAPEKPMGERGAHQADTVAE